MIDKSTVNTLIFDFDGTLADTVELHRQIYNQIAKKNNHSQISSSQVSELKNLSLRDFLRNQNIPLLKLPFLIREGRKLAADQPTPQPINGIVPVIRHLSQQYTLGILTSNTQEYCQRFLDHHDLAKFFDFVQAEKDLFGKDHKLKKIISKNQLTNNEVVYIGDEVRDIESARKVPLGVIGVGWGFNSAAALKKARADIIVRYPRELLSYLLK